MSTAGNPVDELGKKADEVIKSATGGEQGFNRASGLDFLTNLFTGGTLGYEEGRIREGGLANALDEGLGEAMGRNLAREEAFKAEQKLAAEEKAQDDDLANRRRDAHLRDLAASRSAGSLRGQGGSRSGRSLIYQPLGSDEKDFLGL